MNALVRLLLKIAYRAQLVLWWILRPRRRSGHVALCVGDRVLVVRNSYRPALGLPAGQSHPGEATDSGACRELREEVGIHLDPSQLHLAGVSVNRAEYKEDVAHVFEARLEAEVPPRVDGREVIWAGYLTREELGAKKLTIPLSDWLRGRLDPAPKD
ncbi:MAG TPA: NUDIX hydrolase [Planctomycetota bacterium]|nr:NUDIX hydrolase [Planctomycetota bacterium]